MAEIPKKIHYCWLSDEPLPARFKDCFESWTRVMPDYEIVRWDKQRFDTASNTFVREACQTKRWAFAADYIRLYAIFKEGGIYLDADVFVRRRFDDFLKYGFFTAVEYHKHIAEILKAGLLLNPDGTSKKRWTSIPGIGLQAAVMGGVAGHPFLEDCLKYYQNRHFILENGSYYDQVLAPSTYAMVAEAHGFVYLDKKQSLPNNMVVFPSEVFAPALERATAGSYAIHLCAGSWRPPTKEPLLKRMRIAVQKNPIMRRLWGRRPIKKVIEYRLQSAGEVEIDFFSESEECLATTRLGVQKPGKYRLNKQVGDLPPGRFACRIRQGENIVGEQFFLNKANIN